MGDIKQPAKMKKIKSAENKVSERAGRGSIRKRKIIKNEKIKCEKCTKTSLSQLLDELLNE